MMRWTVRNGAALSWLEDAAASISSEVSRHSILVLLHAFPLDARMWQALVAQLNWPGRILRPHWRGFGPAPGTAGPGATGPILPLALDDLADDIAAICAAAQVPSAVFLGCSIGGYVLFSLLRRHPALVAAAVFCDTRPEADTPSARQARLELNAALRRLEPDAAGELLVERMPARLVGATTLSRRPSRIAELERWLREAPMDAVVRLNAAMAERADSTPLLAQLRLPRWVMVGDEDALVDVGAARRFAAAMGTEAEIIPGVGHLAPWEDPPQFAPRLRRFCEAAGLV